MKCLSFLLIALFGGVLCAQTTIEPTSITLGIDQINMIDGDTILHWGKTRSAFRGGFFRPYNITNANTGSFSFAYGSTNTAEKDFSVAMGSGNQASGASSLAIGEQNKALGNNSISIGEKNVVNTVNGVALGEQLIVNSSNTIALGRYNVDYPDTSNVDHKPIFFLGNGDGRTQGKQRSNAITVLHDGRMSLRTTTPESDLHLVHQNGDHKGGFRIENEANGNWWRLYSRSANNELELYNLTSGAQSAVGKFDSGGNYMILSDRRLKENIIDLPYGLKQVLKLSPKKYKYKHVRERNEIGLIAQEVIEIIPELVNFDESKDKYMMNYNGFGVLSIKAIQELHELIEDQKELITLQNKTIEILKTEIKVIKKKLSIDR